MKAKEILKIGYPEGPLVNKARAAAGNARLAGKSTDNVKGSLRALLREPHRFLPSQLYGELAQAVIDAGIAPASPQEVRAGYQREAPLDYAVWGDDIDPGAHEQMRNACRLPVSVAGALMPDAHVGYGLPIGGVLATDHAVIPYAVGVDIA
jgi:tRNA-splicing ligase RtcB